MTRSRRALVVVDVQVGMFDPGDPVHDGPRLLETIGVVLSRARAAGVPVVFVQHDGGEGSGLAPGSPGHAIHPAVAPRPGEPVVHKSGPDSFHNTALDMVLADKAVDGVILCGIQSDLCIDTTCRRASSLGYDVVLVQDGHSTWARLDLSAAQIIAHHNDILCDWFATGAMADTLLR